jgi:DNA polymerase I
LSRKNYGLVDSIESLRAFRDKLLSDGVPFGFDIETGYLGPPKDKASIHVETAIVVGFSFSNGLDWARYAPLAHDLGPNLDNLEAARILWPLLQSGLGVAHNAKFELRHLARFFRDLLSDDPEFGQAVRRARGYFPVRSDTQIESYIKAEFRSFGLKPMTEALFGHKMIELWELFEGLAVSKRKQIRFNILELTPKVVDYACEDALWCLAIHAKYYPLVKDLLLYKTEMALVCDPCPHTGLVAGAVPSMEDYGVLYDWELMRSGARISHEFLARMGVEIQADLSEMVGEPVAINLGSPQQISSILYEKLGMKTSRYTRGSKDTTEKKMSTDAIALEGLSKKYPVVKRILEWKELRKLCTTYLEKYEREYGFAADGKTHPEHLQCAVITGRFAVAGPPYQQSPKKYHYDLNEARVVHAAHAEAHGPQCSCPEFPPPPGTCFVFNFRNLIRAPAGCYLLGYDLSQAELRAVAGEAQEHALLSAFERGEDVHVKTASLMLGVPVDQITPAQRDVGKTLNFAIVYGMQPSGLADRLAISKTEAEALFDAYFAAYPAIAVWAERQQALGKAQGFVTSRFGRRLPIWEFQSEDAWTYSKGERGCVNYPIQGAATGDFMKIAMVRALRAIRKAGLQDQVHLIMNMHDALEFVVDRSLQPQDVISVLEPAVVFSVQGWPPMRADWHVGIRWGSVKEITISPSGELVVGGKSVAPAPVKAPQIDGEPSSDESGGDDLPPVDSAALKAAVVQLQPPLPPSPAEPDEPPPVVEVTGPARSVIVELLEMPEEGPYRRFLELVGANPGPNTVTLRTPEGDLVLDWITTALTPGDSPVVSLLFGGASVIYPPESVDAQALMAGITL